jgi:hypothetical protein
MTTVSQGLLDVSAFLTSTIERKVAQASINGLLTPSDRDPSRAFPFSPSVFCERFKNPKVIWKVYCPEGYEWHIKCRFQNFVLEKAMT